MKSRSLQNLRSEIDELDQKIQLLISERADLAAEVALVKQESNTQTAFYRPEREAEVLSKVIERNKSLLKDKDIALIFREIMSACLALEQPLKIAFLGPEGTFTQEAALKHFGHGVSPLDCGTVDEKLKLIMRNMALFLLKTPQMVSLERLLICFIVMT
jgi:chorismate mutase / prephenate dehydratase